MEFGYGRSNIHIRIYDESIENTNKSNSEADSSIVIVPTTGAKRLALFEILIGLLIILCITILLKKYLKHKNHNIKITKIEK